MVDRPGARATARGDRASEGILQGAAVERGIDASLGDGAGKIGR